MLAGSFENELGLFAYTIAGLAWVGGFSGCVSAYVPDLNKNIILVTVSLGLFASVLWFRGRTPVHVESALSIRRRFHCVHL